MRVICSAGKGEMEHTECLQCALNSKFPPCNMDYRLLNAIFTSDLKERNGIHVTDLVSCPRKVYLDKTDPKPEQVHKALARFKGSAIHAYIEKFSDGNGTVEEKMEWDGVTGSPDNYHNGRLIDYKTTKDIYWNLIPYGEHEVQLNLYAYMLEEMGKKVDSMAIQYISNKGATQCSKCRVEMEWTDNGIACPICGKQINSRHLGVALVEIRKYSHAEMEEVFRHRKSILEKALAEKKLPEGEPGWLCKFCKHECDMRI